jgi:isopentenyl diphosphate isomerase/L-lactate dehydrogenase-like FMN-dependent dehydrogenase
MPSALPEDKLNNAVEVFKAGIRALGLTMGAAKGDIKVTEDGAKIGEIAARLSGGFMSAYTYPLSSGVNLIANAIDIALGNPPENLVPTKNWVSIEKTILPAPGIIKDIIGVDRVLSIDGVKELFLHVGIGDEIVAPKSNVEKPLNYILVRETREEAWKTVEEVEKVLAIVTDDKKKISFQEISKKAKERFAGMCHVCPECNGEACKGLIPGMGGIGDGAAFIRNCKDFKNILIHTRMIHPVKEPDTSCEFLDTKLQLPLLVAPITGCDINMGNQITELEYDEQLISGAKDSGILAFVGDGAQPYLYQTGLRAVQEVQGHAGAIFKPRKNQHDIMTRLKEAEKCGTKIVGIDIDAAAFITMKMIGQEVSTKTVDELKELVDCTDIPFCVKGIMSAGDALCAVDAGVKYLIISNHGGRITPNQPSSISVLPEIKKAVGNKAKLILDGGIRSGEDIFKALALGADYCMIGRPFATAVLGGGRDAVKLLVEKYIAELQKIMLLTGAATIQDITADMVSIIK